MNVYIETYGCQMNVSDTEVILSVLEGCGYRRVEDLALADLALVNTCSVRDNAEQRIWGRIDVFRQALKSNGMARIGVMGCMAERLGEELVKSGSVDLVCGPDAYRRLPELTARLRDGERGIVDTELSRNETYADIRPLRCDGNNISAFISIMRGCNNLCSYCVVPYTRGVERSRDAESIIAEVKDLAVRGYKEVTLLGQNVDSYKARTADGRTVSFASLLEQVALAAPGMRVRFTTSNPHDLSDEAIAVMAKYDNVCHHIHLPVQSGSDAVLARMRRKYTREWYLDRIRAIRAALPDCAITTDVIAGFSGETLEDHLLTVSLMDEVGFDSAFMFQYSERPGTFASRHCPDDVPPDEKTRRLNEIIAHQNASSVTRNGVKVGKVFRVLIEGPSKKSDKDLCGRASDNSMCVFPDKCPGVCRRGQYADVLIKSATSATLLGEEL